jgi:enoyl-CoA hydratase/carnithine racemase
MLNDMQRVLLFLEGKESSTRCLVVTSSSQKIFSAGADLKERNKMTQQQASEFVTSLRNTFHKVSQLPMPVICAMEGLALGGGLEVALACDIRIASSNSIMGLPETTLAIIPGAGGTQRLPRLIGLPRAMELVFTGRRITADVAYQYGLVNQVVPPGEADATALALAWQISKSGPIALRAAKEAMQRGMELSNMNSALQVERECYERTLPTKDRLEGLAAFQEGRIPKYTGE